MTPAWVGGRSWLGPCGGSFLGFRFFRPSFAWWPILAYLGGIFSFTQMYRIISKTQGKEPWPPNGLAGMPLAWEDRRPGNGCMGGARNNFKALVPTTSLI